tara:strand:- start:1972 stop:2346 length:375 start_codon:yes stop_codon:yes gene_type:complete
MLYGVKYKTAHSPLLTRSINGVGQEVPNQSNGWQYLRFESQSNERAALEDQARKIIMQTKVFEHSWHWEKEQSAADIRLDHIWRLESESINDLVPLNHRGVATVDFTIWTLEGGECLERRVNGE